MKIKEGIIWMKGHIYLKKIEEYVFKKKAK